MSKIAIHHRIIARLRVCFGFCPKCNSDAPELYDCKICNGYASARGDAFPPTEETRDNWWRRFKMAKCVHGHPMEDRCPDCSKMIHEMLNRPQHNPRRA